MPSPASTTSFGSLSDDSPDRESMSVDDLYDDDEPEEKDDR
jgi:hypothetical protein